jgi:hypothetical protein
MIGFLRIALVVMLSGFVVSSAFAQEKLRERFELLERLEPHLEG